MPSRAVSPAENIFDRQDMKHELLEIEFYLSLYVLVLTSAMAPSAGLRARMTAHRLGTGQASPPPEVTLNKLAAMSVRVSRISPPAAPVPLTVSAVSMMVVAVRASQRHGHGFTLKCIVHVLDSVGIVGSFHEQANVPAARVIAWCGRSV